MAVTTENISVQKIYLDTENPRHESLPDEPSIIKYLLSKEKVRALARDIADAGATSPIELIAVIKHPKVKGAFVVVEGNRRICALKLLLDPSKAGAEGDVKNFTALAAKMPAKISKVQAAVFDSRELAAKWFALRHKGQQDGIGARPWDAGQITRFNLRNSSRDPNSQAALLIDYARRHKLLSGENIELLNITTITRYLSNPVFRHALGLNDGNSWS